MTDVRTPAVAVIVVNYNSAPYIDEFCASLSANDYTNWRLVVVDAGSRDDSLESLRTAFPSAVIDARTENVGFAAGANAGIELAIRCDAEYVLFLNNDTIVTATFLSDLVAAADECTIVVPKILYAKDHRLISTHAGGFDWRLGLFRDTYGGKRDGPATSKRRDGLETASFCCALVPLEAFRRAGTLDERFFMYYEETDFLWRARQHGYGIRYEPASLVYHRESAASGGGWMTPFKQYYATRNRLYLVRKHATSRTAYAWFTAYFWTTRIGAAGRLVAQGRWRLLRAMFRGALDYYRGRMGRTVQVGDL